MNNTHTFNLKAVMRLTGLSADSLRAWERRYNLPAPGRTPGGQRTYSQRDIATIQWLMTKRSEGLSISNSVGLWNELIRNGTDPLQEDRLFASIQAANFPLGESDSSLDDLRGHWKKACLLFDENLAEQVVNRAFALADPETVCTEILLKGMLEIGESWYLGQASVQQEHFAAGVARRRLGSLISAMPPANRAETILVCCPPGEEHSLPGTCLTFLLRRQGYKVIDLGANVPIAQLKETAESIHPRLVILSAQQLSSAVQIGRCAQALADSSPIGFGGRIFKVSPGLIKHLPVYFLGDTLEEASRGIAETTFHKNRISNSDERENPHRDLYETLELNRHAIHSHLSTRSSIGDNQGGIHDEITIFMNNSVAAALYFGDLDLLLPEMDWLEGFLHNRQYGNQQAGEPLSMYIDSVHQVIGQEAAPLLNWFDLHLSRQNQPGKNS